MSTESTIVKKDNAGALSTINLRDDSGRGTEELRSDDDAVFDKFVLCVGANASETLHFPSNGACFACTTLSTDGKGGDLGQLVAFWTPRGVLRCYCPILIRALEQGIF